jgi:hypothetical protein
VISTDARLQVGVNIDGIIPATRAGASLDRPLLWVQSDSSFDIFDWALPQIW